MRKAPPISTSSPRDTTTSRRFDKVLSISNTAAALLFTTVAASAPVNSRSSGSTTSSRSPRPPVLRSYSRLTGAVRARSPDSCNAAGSSARPKLVCSTVPVRLNTTRKRERAASCKPASTLRAIVRGLSASRSSSPRSACWRSAVSASRNAAVTSVREKRVSVGAKSVSFSNRSSDGISAAVAAVSSDRTSIPVGLPQQRICAGAMIATLAEQQIEVQAGQIIGHRLDMRIFLLIKNFAITAALLTGLRAYRCLGRAAVVLLVHSHRCGMQGNALARGAASAALHTKHVPLRGAQGAMQIAISLVGRLRVHHARHRLAAAQRTQARHRSEEDTAELQ